MKKVNKLLLLILAITLTALLFVACAQVQKTYVITFDNGVKAQTVKEGEKAIQPYINYDTDLYIFGGWFLAEDLSGDAYEFDTIVTADMILYAKLTPKFYAVTFSLGYDTDIAAPTQADTPKSGTFTLPLAPIREGYNFVGWSDGKTITEAGETYTVNATTSVTMTAIWETQNINVRFLDWDGRVITTQKVAYGGSAAAPFFPDTVKDMFCYDWDADLSNIIAPNNEETNTYDINAMYAFTTQEDDTYTYQINAAHTGWIVSAQMARILGGNLILPSSYLEIPCVEVASDGFFMGRNIQSLVVPSSYRKIGEYAFDMCGFSSVTLHEGLKEISDMAFSVCDRITTFDIPASVTLLGDDVFFHTRLLAAVNVAEGNKNYSSDDGVLYDYNKTKLIHYPAAKVCEKYIVAPTVTRLEINSIFYLESSMDENGKYIGLTKEIVLPEGITGIPQGLFSHCYGLLRVNIPSTVTEIGSSARSYSFGGGSCGIGDGCFYSCFSLEKIDIPEGIKFLGSNAFIYAGNDSTVISLPSTLKFAEIGALLSVNYKTITVADGCEVFKVVDNVLYDKSGETLFRYPAGATAENFTVPAGVKTVFCYAFAGCKLKNINFEEGCETVWANAFTDGLGNGSKLLETVSFPASLVTLGYFNDLYFSGSSVVNNGVFFLVENLISVTFALDAELLTIGDMAFRHCYVEQITIPKNVKKLDGAFGDNKLQGINVEEGSPFFKSVNGVLYSVDGKTLYAYPGGRTMTSYAVEEGTEIIASRAFDRNNVLMEIILPAGLREIGYCAFYACDSLTFITLPASVTKIGNEAFNFCNLTSVTVLSVIPPQLEPLMMLDGMYIYTIFSYTTIYVPAEAVDAYKSNPQWATYQWQIMAIPAGE